MTPIFSKSVLPLFSLTLFISAAALFAVQPMAGKMLLPLIGGTPAGWVTAMAFFQVMLLAGYLLAHLLSRFSPRGQALVYLAALGAGLAFLPPSLSAHAGLINDTPGPVGVFRLLGAALAVPFIALSATSSTVQRLFTTTGHADGQDPYFLYAAGNLGSFAGLLSYPFLLEPNLTLTAQARGWQCAYILLVACAAACLFFGKATPAKTTALAAGQPVTARRHMEWLALAFFPSSLLMGVTTYITTDIISIPLIWVFPLGIYLLAFVAGFSRRPPVSLSALGILFPAAITAAVLTIAFKPKLSLVLVAVHLACFAVLAVYCNTRLAALRPNKEKLTEFYLFLALGGALGGIFNAFVAPLVFARVIEYPLCLLAMPLLLPCCAPRSHSGRALLILLAVALALSNVMPLDLSAERIRQIIALLVVVPGTAALLFRKKRAGGYAFSLLAVLFLAGTLLVTEGEAVLMRRNFFGALRVYDANVPSLGGPGRFFMHGTTLHGFQLERKSLRNTPTAYYTLRGPMGQIFEAFTPRSIAVLGLGTGTLACMQAPFRTFTFIEIDPGVIDIAKNQFTHLNDCGRPRLIAGDGRLELERLKNEKFDMIVMDAFSSDSIPVHLLTVEAFRVYLSRLNEKGVLLVNISNRYFKLDEPIAATAHSLGLRSKLAIPLDPGQLEPYATRSAWVIVTRGDVDLDALAEKYGWGDIPQGPAYRPWTDDYTNLLSALEL